MEVMTAALLSFDKGLCGEFATRLTTIDGEGDDTGKVTSCFALKSRDGIVEVSMSLFIDYIHNIYKIASI